MISFSQLSNLIIHSLPLTDEEINEAKEVVKEEENLFDEFCVQADFS